MDQQQWSAVDRYLAGALVPPDPVLAAALDTNTAAGLPAHDVSDVQGKFLHLIARMIGARRVLEIGTLGGYSTIWLARALPDTGVVVTLEADPHHAETARRNIARAGVSDRVVLRVGPALDTLPVVEAEHLGPFALVFIDADKPNNPAYFTWALKLVRPGGVILGDNIVRDGAVVDAASSDPRVQGVRRFIEAHSADPRVSATAMQTVGAKGWDGFTLAVVD